MIDRYLWVIGGGALQVPLIKEANSLGLKTIISDMNKACVARNYCDEFVHIDVFNIDLHIDYLKSCELNIIGVLAAGIDAPETMAAMNSFMGFKGVGLDIALLVKNKDRFRAEFKKLGYPMPFFKIIDRGSLGCIGDILSTMPYPLIVKPTSNSGSRDMKIFEKGDHPLMGFIEEKLRKYDKLLLEEVWYGEEQTVECLVDIRGRFHRGFITDRKFSFESGFPVETGLIHPTQLSEEKQIKLYELAERVAVDLKLDVGVVKLDTIYTKNGPRMIELTVRHSGGFDCQYLVPRSTGKNVLRCAILNAIGEQFESDLLKDSLFKFGVTGSLWPKQGVVTSIEGVDEAKGIDGVEEVFLRLEVGDEIKPYNDCASRVAFIICTGRTLEEAHNTLEKAKSIIKIESNI